jgi:hypothetical protein
MVDYNRQVKDAIRKIDSFAERGEFTVEDIVFHMTRLTGFGEKFTTNYITKALERGFFSKSSGGIISVVKTVKESEEKRAEVDE